MQPTHIYHADWGTDPNKRWIARAQLGFDGRYTAEAPRPVGDHPHLITSIRSEIWSGGSALVGFDFPIGVPERYASASGVPSLNGRASRGRIRSEEATIEFKCNCLRKF
jgi:hypothetical protein